MKPSFKDKFTILIILIPFLLIISFIGVSIAEGLGIIKFKSTAMYTGAVTILDENDTEEINKLINRQAAHGFKLVEGDQYYLIYVEPVDEEKRFQKYKLKTDKEEFDKMTIGKTYYLHVTNVKEGNIYEGIIKKVYIDNPMKR